MISPKKFHDFLKSASVDFFCGVPDSLLKNFCSFIADSYQNTSNHLITANEGGAVALAAGYHMATGKLPLVYLQNSGLGNTVNPILSLIDEEVYSIPVLLMVGWRGEVSLNGSQLKDEPQHLAQGKLTPELLQVMRIPYEIISADDTDFESKTGPLLRTAVEYRKPVALLVRKNTFASEEVDSRKAESAIDYSLFRERAIELIVETLPKNQSIVSTTGMISRELFETRVKKGLSNATDFLTVGSMGHSSQIAMGIALAKPHAKIVCLDGDGAVIMHMGGLTNTGKVSNLVHIVLNNGCHDSVGGQPTCGFQIDFKKIAEACGYQNCFYADNESDLIETLKTALSVSSSSFLEVRVKKGHRKDLGRPTVTPRKSKENFIKTLQSL